MTGDLTIDISALRASLGWSQAKLGKCLGCDQSTIDRLEGGQPLRGPMALLAARLDGLATRHALAGMPIAQVQKLLVVESPEISILAASA